MMCRVCLIECELISFARQQNTQNPFHHLDVLFSIQNVSPSFRFGFLWLIVTRFYYPTGHLYPHIFVIREKKDFITQWAFSVFFLFRMISQRNWTIFYINSDSFFFVEIITWLAISQQTVMRGLSTVDCCICDSIKVSKYRDSSVTNKWLREVSRNNQVNIKDYTLMNYSRNQHFTKGISPNFVLSNAIFISAHTKDWSELHTGLWSDLLRAKSICYWYDNRYKRDYLGTTVL